MDLRETLLQKGMLYSLSDAEMEQIAFSVMDACLRGIGVMIFNHDGGLRSGDATGIKLEWIDPIPS